MPARPPNPSWGWSRSALALGVALALLAAPNLPTASATTTKEAALYAMVNQTRSVQGLGRLSLSERLSRMARRHSRQMARAQTLFHTGCLSCRFPSGSWQALGENVGAAGTVRRVHRMMLGSVSHRATILAPAFDRVGVGVVRKGGNFWVTEIFFG